MRLYAPFRTSFLPAVILLVTASFVVPAISAENYATASGGVTLEDRAAFDAQHNTESLKLVFAGPAAGDSAGEYLSDVIVSIRNAKGEEVVNAKSMGPYFVVALPPGTYQIAATFDGETKTQRTVIDANGGRKSYTLRFSAPRD